MPDAGLHLRPVVAGDLPLLAGWLTGEANRRWWGDPVEQIGLIRQDLAEPLMDQQLACRGGAPFGYLQSYPAHAWPEGAPHLADQPPGAQAVDCFLDPAAMGQGLGSAMLAAYAHHLLAQGASAVLIDPDPSNERAVRAYRRAGFAPIGQRPDGQGDPCLVMRFDPANHLLQISHGGPGV